MLSEDLNKKIKEKVESFGFAFLFLEKSGNVLRLVVEKERFKGITLNQCASLSREISPFLDTFDFFNSSYTLEVSSPGIDRPLIEIADFQHYIGKRAKITTHTVSDISKSAPQNEAKGVGVEQMAFSSDERSSYPKTLIGVIEQVVDDKIYLKTDLHDVVIIKFSNVRNARLLVSDSLFGSGVESKNS